MGKYSDILMDHFQCPRNNVPMKEPDRIGLVGVPGEGPFFLLCLRVRDGLVTGARYQTHGCGPTIAAGSVLTEMIKNRPVRACSGLTVEQLIEALGGVPGDKLHCPAMAVAALREALKPDVPEAPREGTAGEVPDE